MTAPFPHVILEAGVVGYDDGQRMEDAIDSLLLQELPEGAMLRRLWCVAGGDATVEAARRAARRDARVVVIEERIRRGKSAALAEVRRRAEGDLLVLLNGDARARPGALRAMLEMARSAEAPFGIMARPVLDGDVAGPMGGPLTALWQLHHELHAELARRGDLDHLSDELLLVPTRAVPPFAEGIVNDGAFAAEWILAQGGRLLYAEGATVELAPPRGLAEHVGQRRRIRRGHRELGARPTWSAFALRDPKGAVTMLAGLLRARRGALDVSVLVVAEGMALVLGGWDRIRRTDYAVWPRAPPAPPDPGDAPGPYPSGR